MADFETVGPTVRSVLRIGEWHVEPSLNQLRRGTEVVHLEPKSVEVLVALAQHPGEVISREQLLATAWPGVIVGDDALTQAVIKLRKALGDTSRQPKYIETIAKRGYRLVAETVREGPAAPISHAAVTSGERRPWRIASTVAALAVLAISAAAVWMAVGPRGPERAVPDEDLGVLQRGLEQLAAQPTIAVRPFEVIGDDPRQVAVAAGLTSDLITDLSNVAGLTVLGGSRPVRASTIASAALAEHYVVSGTVQRDRQRLRVNVQLTDARAARALWSERFERATDDPFALQDDLLKRLLAVLPVKIDEAERRRSASRYTRSLEAYELFHHGLLAMGARERQQNEAARALYWRAIALDPGFARAYAGVAMTHAQEFRQQWADDGRAALMRAIETAEAARKIDPASPEALWVLAFTVAHDRRHDVAETLAREAIRLSPSYADAYFLVGLLQMETGRPREALAWMHAAMRLVPNPGHIHYFGFGQAYFFAGDLEQARSHLEEAVARNPAHAEAHLYFAATLLELGQVERSRWHVEELGALRPRFDVRAWLERHPVVDRGQRARLQTALERLGLA